MVVLCTTEQLEQFKNDPDWVELPDPPREKLCGEVTKDDMHKLKAVFEKKRI